MELRRIYRTPDASEAHLICNRLEAEGVRANVVGDSLPYTGTGLAGLLEVWISQPDTARATQILRELNIEASEPAPKAHPLRFSILALVFVTTCAAMAFASARALMLTTVLASGIFTIAILVHIFHRRRTGKSESMSAADGREN